MHSFCCLGSEFWYIARDTDFFGSIESFDQDRKAV